MGFLVAISGHSPRESLTRLFMDVDEGTAPHFFFLSLVGERESLYAFVFWGCECEGQ